MGLFKTGLITFFAFTLIPLVIHAEQESKSQKLHAIYLMQTEEVETAIEKYQEIVRKEGPDFEILRHMSLLLLKQGIKKKDLESTLLSIYGAGLALNSSSLEILEEGLFSENPQIQVMALYFISQLNDDRSNELLQVAMNSPFLITRIEACFHMAVRKHPYAIANIEALMQRLPPFFKPFFPPLFAMVGTSDAISELNKLIEDPLPAVRVEAINSLVQFQRDDFIPLIRKHLTHSNIAEKEACAYALGLLKDTNSSPELKKIAEGSMENVKLAALKALYLLGDFSVQKEIEAMAKEQNLFAIAYLGEIPGFENLLAELISSSNLHVRINAALSLLHRKDRRCIGVLREIFLTDTRDLAFQISSSLGRSHRCIKAVPSAQQRCEDPLFDADISLGLRENFLSEAYHLPEDDFLKIARMIFDAKQNDLLPHLISLLENLQTEKTILLLKEQSQKMGAPLIRDYANLALFRLNEEGPYEEYVI